MKVEEHENAYKEHIENVKRAIEEGIEQNQRNIGYNVSQGSLELFAIYMHKLRLIQGSGDQFDHRVFKSKNLLAKKVPVDFPSRIEILGFMKLIEEERNALCYGARKPKVRIEKVILSFNELRRIINENLKKIEGGQNDAKK